MDLTIFIWEGCSMIYKEIGIQAEGSADYVKLKCYILDTPQDLGLKIRKRPVVLICPGGGYEKVSYREGEPVAMHFLSRGYHACVLHYSVAPYVFPAQVLEVGQAVKIIREHAGEWNVDTDKIIVQGASAGGHLAASYGIFWNQAFMADKLGMTAQELKPAGIMLSYPVITSDVRYAHMDSFRNLLGDKFEQCREEMSLENQVTNTMPPCFLWHTMTDKTVPAENTLLMAMALNKAEVPAEVHIFQEGEHGLSLASPLVEREDGSGKQEQCAQWINLADEWLKKLCGM